MHLDDDLREDLLDDSLDESIKIIRFLKEQEKRQKPYNLSMLVLTIISVLFASIAAITGLLMYLQ